jgi:hypothetical protein
VEFFPLTTPMENHTESVSMNADKCLIGGKIHSDHVLVITLSGPEVSKASYTSISAALTGPGGGGRWTGRSGYALPVRKP